MGVVSECCKEEYIYMDILIIIITFPYSTCIIMLFFGSIVPISLFILKMFFCSYIYVPHLLGICAFHRKRITSN